MKRILTALFACASTCFATATFYVDAGRLGFGAGHGVLTNQVTVNLTGAPASQRLIWVYFDFNNELSISLPPGVSGSCAGATCNIFSGDNTTSGLYNGTAGTAPTSATAPYSYGVDAVYAATSSACSSATAGIFPFSAAPFNWPVSDSNNGEYGNKVAVDTAGYICAVRFLKGSADTNAHHTVHLWNGSTSLASATSGTEASSGWITVPITPVAVSPGTVYTASFGITNGSVYYIKNLAENASPHNGPVRIMSHYVDSNGSCNMQDNWPKNPDGLIAAGVVGCGSIATNGSMVNMNATTGRDTTSGLDNSQWNTVEGCQCMIGGEGPGPYAMIGTRIEASGNMWHFDDSGHWWSARGDYYIYRGMFTTDTRTLWGTTTSDDNRYWTRQKLEWKSGRRIYIGGTILEYGQNDLSPSSDTIAISNAEYGITDINLENNEIRHTVGGFNWSGTYSGLNGSSAAPAAQRGRFTNNILWDFGAYSTPGPFSSGNAYFNNGASGMEDFVIDHNTFLPMRGRKPVMFYRYSGGTESIVLTNNIFGIDSDNHGIAGEQITCPNTYGEAATCGWLNFTMHHNVIYPSQWSMYNAERPEDGNNGLFTSTTTAANIASWFPTYASQNYVPTDLASLKFFSLPSFPADTTTYGRAGDYHLRADFFKGATASYVTTDGKPMGADMQAFAIAQGKVDHIGVPTSGITTTSANVVFIAPDSQACPVDYIVDDSSNGDITSGFTRVADTGTANRRRSVALTGLTANTPYRYQILCEVEQPLGRFRTR